MLSNSKCSKTDNKSAQAAADEAALTGYAQQVSDLLMYHDRTPRFNIIQFSEIAEPVVPDASLEP